jgi:peptide/nickel transport system permease protein
VVWGTRTAFKAGLIVTFATLVIGLSIGTIAAYFGGRIDEILMRIVEIFMAVPYLLAALTMAAVLQPRLGRGIWAPMVALIAFGWTTYARLIRGDILSSRSASTCGCPRHRHEDLSFCRAAQRDLPTMVVAR